MRTPIGASGPARSDCVAAASCPTHPCLCRRPWPCPCACRSCTACGTKPPAAAARMHAVFTASYERKYTARPQLSTVACARQPRKKPGGPSARCRSAASSVRGRRRSSVCSMVLSRTDTQVPGEIASPAPRPAQKRCAADGAPAVPPSPVCQRSRQSLTKKTAALTVPTVSNGTQVPEYSARTSVRLRSRTVRPCCSHTLAVSIGWPTTTPLTPAVKPAIS